MLVAIIVLAGVGVVGLLWLGALVVGLLRRMQRLAAEVAKSQQNLEALDRTLAELQRPVS